MAKAYAGFTLAQMKTVAANLEQQLSAANARIAELEKRKPSYKAEFDCVYEKLKAEEGLSEHYKQRAEQAEAWCKRLRVCGNCRYYCVDDSNNCCIGDHKVTRQNTCRDWEMV